MYPEFPDTLIYKQATHMDASLYFTGSIHFVFV